MECGLPAGINKLLEQHPVPEGQYSTWIDSINEVREKFPMWYPEKDDVIIPQWAIQVCSTWQPCEKLARSGLCFGVFSVLAAFFWQILFLPRHE